jgi:hypothetical protein
VTVPEEIREEGTWLCYRLLLLGHVTWTEVTTTMSIDDVDMLSRAVAAWDGASPIDEDED